MPRENRDRRDKERREDRRDRDRHRGSRRDRDYDRSGDSVTGTNLNISGPVVLLKRPDAGQSSGSSASSSATTGSSVYERSGNKSSDIQRDGSQTNVAGNAKPPSLLVRSGQWKKGSVPDVRGNTSSPVPTSDNAEVKIVKPRPVVGGSSILRSKFKFPYDHAIPILNATKDATIETDLQFLSPIGNSTDFFVITAIGVPHAGKSSILSYLGGENGTDFGEKLLFLPRKPHERKEGFMYVTSSKVVLLELPSVFNGAAVNDMMALMGREGTLENAAMSWNLRMVIWALSVSHLVVVVSEDLIAPNLLQLINTASMIHPAESVFGEDAFPELIYVYNGAEASMLENKQAQEAAQSIFASVLGRQSRISQNFFLVPHTKLKSQNREEFENLRIRVDDFIRYNRATLAPELAHVKKFPQNLTLSEWLHASKRVWEDVAQHSSFHSYMKLLP